MAVLARVRLLSWVVFASVAYGALPAAAQDTAPCDTWRTCQTMATAAAAGGDYERFHDLAWRAVQTGPKNDPDLLYLLARAQSLSGRPHDALIMLERIAGQPMAVAALTDDAFERARALPGWAAIEARLRGQPAPAAAGVAVPSAPLTPASPAAPTSTRATTVPPPAAPVAPPAGRARPAPAAPPSAARRETALGGAPTVSPSRSSVAAAAPSTTSSPVTAPSPVPAPPARLRAAVSEAGRFSTDRFDIAGLAYDAVSERMVFGDRAGRKLIVVSNGADHPVDLVRADSAGFQDISAIAINESRGDLWVASGGSGTSAMHRLQLVSGRPLKSYLLDAPGPTHVVDIAVTKSGAVIALDAARQLLLTLVSGGTQFEAGDRLDVQEPTSLATADDTAIYVSHREGVLRVDLRTRRAVPVTAPPGTPLDHFERIRYYQNTLIGVRVDDAGTRQVMRLELNERGNAVTRGRLFDAPAPDADPVSLSISGDQLLYVVRDAAERPAADRMAGQTGFVVYRIGLRDNAR